MNSAIDVVLGRNATYLSWRESTVYYEGGPASPPARVPAPAPKCWPRAGQPGTDLQMAPRGPWHVRAGALASPPARRVSLGPRCRVFGLYHLASGAPSPADRRFYLLALSSISIYL